jgi:ribonuclease-3
MDLEKALGYSFQNRRLLQDALTHKSFYHENPGPDCFYNERLEFLGDTVLGLVIAELLYLIGPPLLESEMAKIKSYLVSGKTLSHIADTIDLGKYIRLGKGEIGTGGRAKASILSDTMESVFGAVFIDGGFESARRIIRKLYGETIEETLENKKYLDYKTELQEICQSRYGKLPQYSVISEEGLEHKKLFTIRVSVDDAVLGKGSGSSKKGAEINAARDAYLKMQCQIFETQ